MHILTSLFKEIAVFLVIAYLFSKTPIFRLLQTNDFRFRNYLVLYLFFSSMAIIGTYLGEPIDGVMVNNRIIGVMIAGLIGGPVLGLAVGFTAGIHRYFLGGFTVLPIAMSAIIEGLFSGLVHQYFFKRRKNERIFDPDIAFATTLISEILQIAIIIAIIRPMQESISLVKLIVIPMIISNSLGTALIMSLLKDQRLNYDKIGATYSKQALRIAKRILGELSKGLNNNSAESIANILLEETSVGAVAITDKENILAFVGIGRDHHNPGSPIASEITKASIKENRIMFLDGKDECYQCPISENCLLSSVLVVPMRIKDEVIGTIKLYGKKNRYFFKINETLGKGIAEIVGNQLLISRYEDQKNLLTRAELNLIQAQIKPHFLFNTINTIIAINRRDPEKAIDLLVHLSNFFRKILKRNEDISTIKEELEHVNSYLEIEKVRLQNHLKINIDVDENLMDIKIPTFSFQPLVENAIKHGISTLLDNGELDIRIFRKNGYVQIDIEDNAGTFIENKDTPGLGVNIVDKRIKNLAGVEFGVKIYCDADIKTVATIILPAGGVA